MSHALAQLHQAAAVATRYQLSPWFLSMHFVEAVLTTPVSLQDADGGLMVGIMANGQHTHIHATRTLSLQMFVWRIMSLSLPLVLLLSFTISD